MPTWVSRAAETHWPLEKPEVLEDDLMADLFENGYVDVGIFQPTSLRQWYTDGFNTTERNGALAEKRTGQVVVNSNWDPRWDVSSSGRARRALARRASSSTPRSGWATRAVEAHRSGGLPIPRQVREARDQEHPRAQGTDHLAARQGRLRRVRRRPRGDGLPEPQLHRRACRSAAHRGLASWPRRSPTCTPVSPSSSVG